MCSAVPWAGRTECSFKSSKDQEGIWRLMSSGTLASFSQFDFPAFIADMF